MASSCAWPHQWLALEVILSSHMTKHVPTRGSWGKITQPRTSWSTLEPLCSWASHWWRWRCAESLVGRLSSPPGGKSWGTERQDNQSAKLRQPATQRWGDIHGSHPAAILHDDAHSQAWALPVCIDGFSLSNKWPPSHWDCKENDRKNVLCFLYKLRNGSLLDSPDLR